MCQGETFITPTSYFHSAISVIRVGGLTKLIYAFVRDVPLNSNCLATVPLLGLALRFWLQHLPNFETIDDMDPLPMFVGENILRRHAVGAVL